MPRRLSYLVGIPLACILIAKRFSRAFFITKMKMSLCAYMWRVCGSSNFTIILAMPKWCCFATKRKYYSLNWSKFIVITEIEVNETNKKTTKTSMMHSLATVVVCWCTRTPLVNFILFCIFFPPFLLEIFICARVLRFFYYLPPRYEKYLPILLLLIFKTTI